MSAYNSKNSEPKVPPMDDPPLPDSYEPEDNPGIPTPPSEIPDEPQETNILD